MSYEPTNWKTGDVVTSAKLNKLENAVAQSGGIDWFVINATSNVHQDPLTIDKTWQEIKDAYASGKIIVLNLGDKIITQSISDETSPGELWYIEFIIPHFLIEDQGGIRLTVELRTIHIDDTGVNGGTQSIMINGDGQ